MFFCVEIIFRLEGDFDYCFVIVRFLKIVKVGKNRLNILICGVCCLVLLIKLELIGISL